MVELKCSKCGSKNVAVELNDRNCISSTLCLYCNHMDLVSDEVSKQFKPISIQHKRKDGDSE